MSVVRGKPDAARYKLFSLTRHGTPMEKKKNEKKHTGDGPYINPSSRLFLARPRKRKKHI